jgi:anthranilate synthase component 1
MTSRALIRTLDVPPGVLRILAAAHPDRYPALLDSAADGPLGRLSILAALPTDAIVAHSNTHDFLDTLERRWLAERARVSAPDLPFIGGWVVFLAYEIAKEVEPRLALPANVLPWNAFALRTPCALVHEKASGQVLAVAEPEAAYALDILEADARNAAASMAKRTSTLNGAPGSAADATRAPNLSGLAVARSNAMSPEGSLAANAVDSMRAPSLPLPIRARSIREQDPALYLERVARAKEYIRDGDIYQANLSRPWRIELADKPDIANLYARLCATNPAPFAALVQWDDVALLSSSPERLVRIGGGHIETRPIAGTRPRTHAGKDLAEVAELTAHPKERAEHIMLIDLERNDLGRVCEPGSVRVDELMVTETYAHVHHIVSNVRGHLRPDVTPVAALRAVFPGGTITGVPKFRCMQIIAELEGEGRGAYTGSLGFLSRDGTMDLNILIRTMTLRGQEIELRAGAGIVADSVPQRELEETRAKARGLLAVFESIP